YGVQSVQVCERDVHVAADSKDEVDAGVEGRDRLGVQHCAGCGVSDLHLFAARGGVPIKEVQRQVVDLAVSQVNVDGKTGGGVPAGGDASGAAGILQRSGVGGTGGPDIAER